MKKKYLFLPLLIVSFFISTYMYPFDNSRNYYYTLSMDDDPVADTLDKLAILYGHQSSEPRSLLFPPLEVYQNSSYLKISILRVKEKLNIKAKYMTKI